MALTHNLFVNVDEFANMGPSQQGRLKQILSKVKVNGRPQNQDPYRTGHEIPELREKANQQRDLPIISVQKWRKHAEKYVENLYKKGLVAAKRVVWCSVSVVSTPTLHATKLINNQRFKHHRV